MRFLKITEGIIRRHYFPLYEADRGREWAESRYPKRFYDDRGKVARADNFHRYPQQPMIATIFKQGAQLVDQLWKLRVNLRAQD